jgi:hypothetical protein
MEVTPQTWQKGIGAPTRKSKLGDSNKDHKKALKQIAQQRFPKARFWTTTETYKITDDVADALLIAEYGWNLERKEKS